MREKTKRKRDGNTTNQTVLSKFFTSISVGRLQSQTCSSSPSKKKQRCNDGSESDRSSGDKAINVDTSNKEQNCLNYTNKNTVDESQTNCSSGILVRTKKKLQLFALSCDSGDGIKCAETSTKPNNNILETATCDNGDAGTSAGISSRSNEITKAKSYGISSISSDRPSSSPSFDNNSTSQHNTIDLTEELSEDEATAFVEAASTITSSNKRLKSRGVSDDAAKSQGPSQRLAQFSSNQNKTVLKQQQAVGKKVKSSVKNGGVKYTPLEQQYVEFRDKYPDAVLFIECGYKYRFFGNDAKIAAEVLKIYAHEDHNFMTASIPVHRLSVHVRRIVTAGYKVGVIRQIETAALKAASSNKNAPFTRQLTAMYTKATLIGLEFESSAGDETETASASSVATVTNYLMCICEEDLQERQSERSRRKIGVVAVQPSTGDVVYDSFEDTLTRSELETRMSHVQPVEVIVSADISMETQKLLESFQSVSNGREDMMRIEKLSFSCQAMEAFRKINDFYKASVNDAGVLQAAINFSPLVQCCLANLLTYLTDFNLHSVLADPSTFTQFAAMSGVMHLDSRALKNLEIFYNQTDGRVNGTLFSVINHTLTRPGTRMLRAWLANPLTSYSLIMARQDAVAELLTMQDKLSKVKVTLSRLPDLERRLTAAYYKKCNPSDFYSMVEGLKTLHDMFETQKEAALGHVTSELLEEITHEVPDILRDMEEVVKGIDKKSAMENQKTELFAENADYPRVVECHRKIREVNEEIHKHRRYVRLTTGQPALEYTTILGTEFLIEVRHSQMNRVPSDWTTISSTKTVGRFHTPFIVEKYKELLQAREQLVIESEQAWIAYLEKCSCRYQKYKKAVRLVSTLDCLISLATVAMQDGYIRPKIVEDESCIEVVEGCHPVVQNLLSETQQYVANDTAISIGGEHVMLITGPNMGGKSCYIRQVALLCILAQIGCHVPALSARLGIIDAIYTRMGALDDIFSGRSTFMVELQETRNIMSKATSRSLVIMDELGRGTSTHDGVAIAYATLQYFIKEVKCLMLFVTHYPMLAEFEQSFPSVVANYHMSFYIHEEQPPTTSTTTNLTFLYQLVRGMADRSYGLNVARLAGISDSIVDVAAVKSHHMEATEKCIRNKYLALQLLFSTEVEDTSITRKTIKELIN